VTVRFDPSARDGWAHVYIEPMPALLQKLLQRIVTMPVEDYPPPSSAAELDG
jgi:hypothetical protein